MTDTDLVLDGSPARPADVAAAARGGRRVQAGAGVASRMTAAHEAAGRVAASSPVYGRTTGVGANSVVPVADALAHDRRVLASHATTGGDVYPDEVARAAMLVRANQLARAASGASPAGYDGLVAALQAGAVATMHRWGGVGTGDLGALAELVRALVGDDPWRHGEVARVTLAPGDVLALLSSNAVTVAEAALAAADLAELLAATLAVAALTLAATGGNLEAFDPVVHAGRPHPGQVRAAAAVTALLAGAGLTATRLQDPFGLRAFPQVHGAALDALAALDDVLTVETGAAAENPRVVVDGEGAPGARVLHHGNWHEAPLALALDHARLAVVGTATLSARRLAMLLEPHWTGLTAFLARGAEGSSGAMGLDYVAAAALARLRALAAPVTLGQAVLSLGVEDHASFAPEAARLAAESLEPLRTILAAELVAAVRALRLGGLRADDLEPSPLAGVLRAAYDALPSTVTDRSLRPDLALAAALLPTLGDRVRRLEVTDE